MLEVLISIALIALTTSFVAPNLIKMLDRHEIERIEQLIEASIYDLQMHASINGTNINVTTAMLSRSLQSWPELQQVEILTPLHINSAGQCNPSSLRVTSSGATYVVNIEDRTCSISMFI